MVMMFLFLFLLLSVQLLFLFTAAATTATATITILLLSVGNRAFLVFSIVIPRALALGRSTSSSTWSISFCTVNTLYLSICRFVDLLRPPEPLNRFWSSVLLTYIRGQTYWFPDLLIRLVLY